MISAEILKEDLKSENIDLRSLMITMKSGELMLFNHYECDPNFWKINVIKESNNQYTLSFVFKISENLTKVLRINLEDIISYNFNSTTLPYNH